MAALLLLGSASESPAQNLGALLEAVDKIEANLAEMVQQEAATRDRQITELKSTIAEFDGSAPAGGVTEEQLADVMAELATLRIEVQGLKRTLGDNAKQLASLDDEGFYVPTESDPEVAQLTERLVELNATLESVLADKSSAGQSNPSVKHGKIALSAFVHEQFASGPDETSTFVSKRARMTLKGDINEYAQIKIQGEFANSPKLLDGQVTISPHKQWSFSIGQYKPPFGTDFLTSASSTPFVNRSKAYKLATDRDVGFSMSYRNSFSPDFSLKLTTGLFNGSEINTSDVNNHKNFVARLEAGLVGMFTLSPNVYVGKTNEDDTIKEDLLDVGGSLTWKWRQEIVEAEYIHSERGDTERRGWYVWGGHSFNIGLGFLQELQLLARYEQYDPDATADGDQVDRLTMGTNLFVDKKYTKIQLNYELNSEQGASIDNDEFLVNVQVAF
jgi:regulator of replication initiation timing